MPCSRCRPQRRARNENTLGEEANERRDILVPLPAAENGAAVRRSGRCRERPRETIPTPDVARPRRKSLGQIRGRCWPRDDNENV